MRFDRSEYVDHANKARFCGSTRSPIRPRNGEETEDGMKKEGPVGGPPVGILLLGDRSADGLRGKGCYDVGEDVLDLVTHRKKDDDDHDRNEDQDQGVLDHTLAFLTDEKAAELPIKVRHSISHLLLIPEFGVLTR